MDKKNFKELSKIIYNEAGIVLNDSKDKLLENRIRPRLKILGLNNEKEYIKYLKDNEEEVINLLDRISTNVTQFYREKNHFIFLGHLVKSLQEKGEKNIKIWSAATSTGMEPYTIAITMLENLQENVDFKILATDISVTALKQAAEGVYKKKDVESIPKQILSKYFEKISIENYKIKDFVKQYITFGNLNLLHIPYPMRGSFDVIFCRNVMIYFDDETRSKIVNAMSEQLKRNGVLITGHSESINRLTDKYIMIKASIYQRKI